MDEFFSMISKGAEAAFDFLLGSRGVLEYAKLAGMAIVQPASLTFGIFLNAVIGTLKDPVVCEKMQMSEDELYYYAILATLSASVYLVAEEEKQENTAPSLQETIFGIKHGKKVIPEEAGEIVYESKESKIDRMPFFITYSEKYNQIFIAIRGSYTFADFITDLKLSPIEVDGTLMHSGVFSSANTLYARVEEHLIQLSKDHNNCPIVFTGHSLGGGIAAVTARFFRTHHPEMDARAVCFAPVATIGIEGLIETEKYVTSFVLGGDPVPFLSLHNVAQVSETGYRWINKIIDQAVSREIAKPLDLPENLDMISNPFEAEPPSLEKIKEDLANTARRTTALFPPGRSIHIAYEGDTFKHVYLEDIEDPVEYFGFLRNNSNDNHHSVQLYKDSLFELYRIEKIRHEPN